MQRSMNLTYTGTRLTRGAAPSRFCHSHGEEPASKQKLRQRRRRLCAVHLIESAPTGLPPGLHRTPPQVGTVNCTPPERITRNRPKRAGRRNRLVVRHGRSEVGRRSSEGRLGDDPTESNHREAAVLQLRLAASRRVELERVKPVVPWLIIAPISVQLGDDH